MSKIWPISRSFERLSVRERDISRMRVEVDKPGSGLEGVTDVKRIGLTVAEEFLQPFVVDGHHVFVEVGDFPRVFAAGEVEEEGTAND